MDQKCRWAKEGKCTNPTAEAIDCPTETYDKDSSYSGCDWFEPEERCLWGFSRNLIIPPSSVKVIKECPKSFLIDSLPGQRIKKVLNPDPQSYIGYNSYYIYYPTEESAKSAYERMKKEENDRALHSSLDYIKEQAIKEFCDTLLDELDCKVTARGMINIEVVKTTIDKIRRSN